MYPGYEKEKKIVKTLPRKKSCVNDFLLVNVENFRMAEHYVKKRQTVAIERNLGKVHKVKQ